MFVLNRDAMLVADDVTQHVHILYRRSACHLIYGIVFLVLCGRVVDHPQ